MKINFSNINFHAPSLRIVMHKIIDTIKCYTCLRIKRHENLYTLKWVCIISLLFSVTANAGELTGTWTGTEDTGEPYTFIFSNTDWSLAHDTGDDWQQGTYTLNDNADPKQLDLYISGASENQFIAETALFIYKIEGNTLTLTGGQPGDNYRPTDFAEGGTTRTFIVTNENRDTDEPPANKENSDDDDNVKVYVNCFVGTVQN